MTFKTQLAIILAVFVILTLILMIKVWPAERGLIAPSNLTVRWTG